MNLVIEFDERLLATIAENNIRRLFQFNDFSSGEFALHVEQATKDAALKILAEINFEDQIKESVQTYAHGIIDDVVIKELKKKVKRVVMELSLSGELIADSHEQGVRAMNEQVTTDDISIDSAASVLRSGLERLSELAKRAHTDCEDRWYSCPKSEDGCSDDRRGPYCDCGADKHNAEVDALMALIRSNTTIIAPSHRTKLEYTEALHGAGEADEAQLARIVKLVEGVDEQ